jgi:mono/diheme cytochrome c family protein
MLPLLAFLWMAPQPPFLARHCGGCHAPNVAAGGLNLQALGAPSAANREQWARILKRIEAGEMPPKGQPRPDANDAKAFTAWIAGELSRLPRSTVTARRLNRVEYNNTVRDLLGVDLHAADDFPQDDSAFGFDNIAEALTVSPLLLEKQFAAAERIARQALFGPDAKTQTQRWEVPAPRRMEVTNPVKLTTPAYYSMFDYDVTGLSQPGSFHLTHRFPAEGDYVFRVIGAGNRPAGSEPGEMTFWIDGKMVQRFPVDEVMMSGFERRPDYWEVRTRLTAGMHDIVAAFPRQFEGLPPRFKGPNPSHKPEPPLPDPEKTWRALPPDAPPGKIEERRLAIEKAREQLANPRWEGMAVMEVEVTGPYDQRKGASPESLRKIFVCGHPDGRHQPGCIRKILSSLANRAFRRPATTKEVDGLSTLAATTISRGGSFEEGIAVGIQAILVSPAFLFRLDGGGDHALASRLSYFLWSTMPDEDLRRRADDGTLSRPAVLAAEVRRMLADGKSRALVENFAGQWLEIRRLESAQPDRDRFPDFEDYLRKSMVKETELFVENMIREDRSILDLIDGSYSFLNERLARHYGIRGVTGTEFRKVDVSQAHRSGILTQASILTASSYATRTSPVLRGKWILENLLNAPPPPPPPNVPALDEKPVGEAASLRVQLERHRSNQVCASCHARMDPLGFALENYDATGAYRTQEGKIPIDPEGALPDGTPLQGPDSLKRVLRQNSAAFAACLTEKLMIYALGRGLDRNDEAAVKQIVADAAATNYRFSSLILGIVNSPSFLKRGEP